MLDDMRPPLSPGTPAPDFVLHDAPHSRVTLADFSNRLLVLVFYVADWHPVATAQLRLYQDLLPHLRHLGAAVVGVSTDGCWSHAAYARAIDVRFPLLADDAPPAALAHAYGVYASSTRRSQRAIFVVDGRAIVRWSATFPDNVNPGADGMLSALEGLRLEPEPCACEIGSGLIGRS